MGEYSRIHSTVISQASRFSVFFVRIRFPDPFSGGAVHVRQFYVSDQFCFVKSNFYCQTNTLYTILSENCGFLSVLCGSASIFPTVLHLKICRQHSSWTPFHHTLVLSLKQFSCFISYRAFLFTLFLLHLRTKESILSGVIE